MPTFTDESAKLYIGRFLELDEIPAWIDAQNPGTQPATGIVLHHTWSPDVGEWTGAASLAAIFRYFEDVNRWPKGKGPHFFVGPRERGGPWGAWVGTHFRHDGIGAKGANHRRVHIEHVWNGDRQPFSSELLAVSTELLRALGTKLGVPLRFTPWDQAGLAFHREVPNACKSCPGSLVTREQFEEALMPPADDWTPEARFLAERKLAQGYPDGTFRPSQPLTRGQFAAVMARYLGYRES